MIGQEVSGEVMAFLNGRVQFVRFKVKGRAQQDIRHEIISND